MRKFLRALWILWLLLAVANLLFVNVYIKHLGDGIGLGLYQQLGYLGLSAVLMMLVGIWWIGNGRSGHHKFVVALGSIVTAVFGIVIVGGTIYALAFGGQYLGVIVEKLAGWFAAIAF